MEDLDEVTMICKLIRLALTMIYELFLVHFHQPKDEIALLPQMLNKALSEMALKQQNGLYEDLVDFAADIQEISALCSTLALEQAAQNPSLSSLLLTACVVLNGIVRLMAQAHPDGQGHGMSQDLRARASRVASLCNTPVPRECWTLLELWEGLA
eukprot:g74692.t1